MNEGFTIFYADDDPDDLDFFRDATKLISKNIRVCTHSGGEKLIQDLKSLDYLPAIVFLDINMPGKNGLETLQEIRENSRFKDIPVVIFSTACDSSYVSQSLSLGASLYVKKSTSFEKFRKSIEFALNINWETFHPSGQEFVYR
ncbi:MAG: response regulator [Flavobacterium sp.]|nr:MAG: response regulator [Flavobacterium sp.]